MPGFIFEQISLSLELKRMQFQETFAFCLILFWYSGVSEMYFLIPVHGIPYEANAVSIDPATLLSVVDHHRRNVYDASGLTATTRTGGDREHR